MSKEIGIEKLKELTIWNSNLFNEIFELVEKAKIQKKKGRKLKSGWQALKFVDNLISGIGLMLDHEQIRLEWNDLDSDEKLQIQKLIKDNFEIQDDFAEEAAERIFYTIIEIGDTIKFITSKKLKK